MIVLFPPAQVRLAERHAVLFSHRTAAPECHGYQADVQPLHRGAEATTAQILAHFCPSHTNGISQQPHSTLPEEGGAQRSACRCPGGDGAAGHRHPRGHACFPAAAKACGAGEIANESPQEPRDGSSLVPGRDHGADGTRPGFGCSHHPLRRRWPPCEYRDSSAGSSAPRRNCNQKQPRFLKSVREPERALLGSSAVLQAACASLQRHSVANQAAGIRRYI